MCVIFIAFCLRICVRILTKTSTRLRALGSISSLGTWQFQGTIFLKKKEHFIKIKRIFLCLLQNLGGMCPQCSRVPKSMTRRFFFIRNLDKLIALRVSSFHIKISAFDYWKFLDSFLISGCLYILLSCIWFLTYNTIFSKKEGYFGNKTSDHHEYDSKPKVQEQF